MTWLIVWVLLGLAFGALWALAGWHQNQIAAEADREFSRSDPERDQTKH